MFIDNYTSNVLLFIFLHMIILQVPRKKWVLQWPGQVVICASSIFWTSEVSEAIETNTLHVSHLIHSITKDSTL